MFIKRKIQGGGNKIEILRADFRGISISICGEDNLVRVASGTKIRNCRFLLNGNGNSVVICGGSDFRGAEFTINGNGSHIKIGSGNDFSSGYDVFCVSGDGSQISVGERNLFAWGNHNLTAEGGTTLFVGDDCLFSNDIYVRTSDSHSIISLATGKKLNSEKDVSIGNHVWIAPCVKILKGASIQDGSVVGTGAVVTSAFSDKNVVIAGVPAKVVKKNIRWEK